MTDWHGPPPGPPTVRSEILEIWDEVRFTIGHIRDLPHYWRMRSRWERIDRG